MARSVATDSTPHLTNGSISSCDDIEGGYSSQEDEMGHAKELTIVPKCIMIDGHYTRRLSQCENLPTRRHSKPETTATAVAQPEPTIYSHRTRQPVNKDAPKLKIVTIMCGILLFLCTIGITYFIQHNRVQSLHEQVNVLHKARRQVEESHSKLSQELQTASHNLARYKNTHENMKKVQHDMSEHMRRMKEEASMSSEMEKRAENAEGRFQSVVDTIRSFSAQQVLQKYGPGPHKVELIVELPTSQDLQTIKLDLASIDTKNGMPHAVHTFLEQVNSKAWDGASFSFHGGHVLLAVPSDSKQQASTVLFPEYSHQYPHDAYTVAFPGRPGTGQDFYINVEPNVISHSPRMEDGKFIEGEPCFARIVDASSRRIVDQMNKIPVNSDGSLKDLIVIHEARIVGFEGKQ